MPAASVILVVAEAVLVEDQKDERGGVGKYKRQHGNSSCTPDTDTQPSPKTSGLLAIIQTWGAAGATGILVKLSQ